MLKAKKPHRPKVLMRFSLELTFKSLIAIRELERNIQRALLHDVLRT